ncbi:epoxyqueuosine reductase QueH [Lachnospiraceae bacterium 62-35]
MNRRNYQRELELEIEKNKKAERIPRLLLHSCCAPCSSYVLEYLSCYFEITVYYYNPNIYPEEEYEKRIREQELLIRSMPLKNRVSLIAGSFTPEVFYEMIKGHEEDKEGGERCFLCYRMRLREAAREAAEGSYDYFTTTLSISPLKNADKLNEIGEELAEEFGVKYLPSDFKKRDGYKRSVQLSEEYRLYRQNYCGCVFSKKERETVLLDSNRCL